MKLIRNQVRDIKHEQETNRDMFQSIERRYPGNVPLRISLTYEI